MTKKKQKTLTLTSMTKGGIASLISTYTKKLGCTVIGEPRPVGDSGAWTVTLTHPFQED